MSAELNRAFSAPALPKNAFSAEESCARSKDVDDQDLGVRADFKRDRVERRGVSVGQADAPARLGEQARGLQSDD